MTTRTRISFIVAMMVSSVLFGIGAVMVLSIKSLNVDAAFWLPVVIVVSIVISPFLSWAIAPMMRARWMREHQHPHEAGS
jgi:ABC-type sulfate transport system permease subunit